jgi:hypothetical protein
MIWRIFGWPIIIGLVSAAGFATALLASPDQDLLPALACGAGLLPILVFLLRQPPRR